MTKAFLPLLANNFKIMFGLSKDFKQRRRDIGPKCNKYTVVSLDKNISNPDTGNAINSSVSFAKNFCNAKYGTRRQP
mgnify:CR=1 FL=1